MCYMFRPIAAIIRYIRDIAVTLPSICYTSVHWQVFTHWERLVQVCLCNALMI
jgi:hypothetical protein